VATGRDTYISAVFPVDHPFFFPFTLKQYSLATPISSPDRIFIAPLLLCRVIDETTYVALPFGHTTRGIRPENPSRLSSGTCAAELFPSEPCPPPHPPLA
jgi:hypothetical protein